MVGRRLQMTGVALACLGLAAGMLLAWSQLDRPGIGASGPARDRATAPNLPEGPTPSDPSTIPATTRPTPQASRSARREPTPAASTSVIIPPHPDLPEPRSTATRALVRPVADEETSTPTPSPTPGETPSSAPATPTPPVSPEPSTDPTPTADPTPTPSPSPTTDTVPPSKVSDVRVTTSTSHEYVIEWQAAVDNVGVTGYQVRINGARQYTTDPCIVIPITTNESIHVEVRAFDAAHNVGKPTDLWVTGVEDGGSPTPSTDSRDGQLAPSGTPTP